MTKYLSLALLILGLVWFTGTAQAEQKKGHHPVKHDAHKVKKDHQNLHQDREALAKDYSQQHQARQALQSDWKRDASRRSLW